MPQGINPVTFHGFSDRGIKGKRINVSVSRMWIGADRKEVKDGQHRLDPGMEKLVTILVWDGPDDKPHILSETILDEDHFIRGLQHLFPNGELNLKD